MPAPPIQTEGLSKRFSEDVPAVDRLDLTVEEGQIFGLLGPNGAGKTTTLRMLVGLVHPTEGASKLFGETVYPGTPSLRRVGTLVESPGFVPHASGMKNLELFWRAGGQKMSEADLDGALEIADLGNAIHRKVKTYSHGMKQRLGIAAALLQPRDLLVLDEPTNGLDPQGMREIRALIKTLAADGTTVFLSSHLLDEIEQVCTHAAVMSRGRLVSQGTVAQLGAGQRARLVVNTPDAAAAETVLKVAGGTDLRAEGERVHCDAEGLEPDAVCAALVAAGVRVFGFGIERPSLEDAFVALTGEGFDVAE
jgi:ABC-type multidrug transport system ATPase subunit